VDNRKGAAKELPFRGGFGLSACDADIISLESVEAGACGTTIFRKHVGHSIFPPLVLESAVMCWPQTGHANLNSLIRFAQTIPHRSRLHNSFFTR